MLACVTLPLAAQAPTDSLPPAPEPANSGALPTLAGGIVVERATPGELPLSLDEAIAMGLRKNVQIEVQRQNENRVHGLQSTVVANLVPTLKATAYTRTQEINLAAMGFKPSSLAAIAPGLSIAEIVKVNTTSAQLNVSQQVFNVPALYLYRAARSAGSVADLATLNVRGGVALAVGTQYLKALADVANIENARALEKADQVALDQATSSRRAGVGTNLDALRAQVQLQTQQQVLVQAEDTYAKDRISLARLIEVPAEQELKLTDTVPFAELPQMPLPEIMQLAFQRRKDLLMMQAQLEVADRTQKAIRYQRLPTLAVNGFYGVLGETTGLYHGVFTAQGSLNIPIFREAEFRGEGEVASAQVIGLRNNIAALRQTIEAQIRSSLLDVQTANDLSRVARSNVDLATEELDQAQQRFAAGVSDNLPVVQAQASLAAADNQLVQATYQFNAAKLQLARNTGVVETQYKAYLGR